MALFDQDDLAAWMGQSVRAERVYVVEQVVAGWLLEATGLAVLPDPVPGSPLYSWALELGGIAYSDPKPDDLGDPSANVSSTRRAQILAQARAWAARQAGTAGGPPSPRGAFPPVTPYPDFSRPRAGWVD